ncbi:MAG: nucleoside kinase [Clostridia bacterium]|nr:nucleoside kinase [Clostridia bacterium]
MTEEKAGAGQCFLPAINNDITYHPLEYIRYCERSYEATLNGIARKLGKGEGRKILLLAGPSSSGKTTSANKLSRLIRLHGRRCYVVHMDDFYRNRDEAPLGPDGKPDFECPESLHLGLLKATIASLEEDGRAMLPQFDFTTGQRQDYVRKIHLHKGDVVIIEGLHALNPVLTDGIGTKNLYKSFVSVESAICDGEGELFLGPRDVRILRRMIRDYNYRNSSVENTLSMWPDVLRGEELYLFPYREAADFSIDSLHPYEIGVYKNYAEPLLTELPEGPFHEQAVQIRKKFEQIEPVDPFLVPRLSLLQEFIKR